MRDLRKENEVLLREQKRLRDETAAASERARQLEESTRASVQDLTQQISDLSFYVRAQHTMESTISEAELQGSQTVVVSNPQPEAKSSSQSKARRDKKR